MPEADIYWHSIKKAWSIRVAGRVVDHLPCVTATRCRMVVRETERQRAIARSQRSVHAFIQGEIHVGDTLDHCADLVEIGYSPWHAGTFTTRPDFRPIRAARLVVFVPSGQAYALP
ncbi:hypothetical protein [Microvirga sp. Mcv34]|uniref:hypothetical protein n=1 Tax=Microvirga sp. Mcv34 TaxID=2926016 RepID=UPI0021C8D710|nr:hypothetical protein [Microvirga sp. Mcv34]